MTQVELEAWLRWFGQSMDEYVEAAIALLEILEEDESQFDEVAADFAELRTDYYTNFWKPYNASKSQLNLVTISELSQALHDAQHLCSTLGMVFRDPRKIDSSDDRKQFLLWLKQSASSSRLNDCVAFSVVCARAQAEKLHKNVQIQIVEESGSKFSVDDITHGKDFSNLLANLTTNAVRYTDADDVKITIRCVSTEHGYVIEVNDNGIGFQQENLARIGQGQLQEGRVAVEDSQGVGLLSAVASAKKRGWSLYLRSDTSGGGSSWRIVIPFEQLTEANEVQQSLTWDGYQKITD